jgi:predicted nucleic acid-binding protein
VRPSFLGMFANMPKKEPRVCQIMCSVYECYIQQWDIFSISILESIKASNNTVQHQIKYKDLIQISMIIQNSCSTVLYFKWH